MSNDVTISTLRRHLDTTVRELLDLGESREDIQEITEEAVSDWEAERAEP